MDGDADSTMVVEDSEPERENQRERERALLKARPRIHWPAPSTTSNAASASASDSDIEIIAGPSKPAKTASTTTKTRKRRSNDNVGGFKSAAAILKQDAKLQSRRLAKQERKPSTDMEYAHNSPVTAAASTSSHTTSVHVLEDDDDEVFNLPPPLSTTLRDDEPEEMFILPQDNSIPIADTCDSPASLFRNNISKFRANGVSASTSSSSLFAPRARPSFSKSTSLSALSDSSSASTSSRGTSKLARAKSASASTSTSISPELTIPTPYLAIITSCPVCQASWTVSKSTSSKSSHITKCAITRAYAPRTVLEIVERTIKEMKEKVEDERRKMMSEKTLFEDLVSRKGKQVLVVGVEQKVKSSTKSTKGKNASDIENNNPSIDIDDSDPEMQGRGKGRERESTAVLFTQGGSAHSQATSTQVQRELNTKIKTNQKLAKGAFLPNLPAKVRSGEEGNGSTTTTTTSLVGVSMKSLATDQKATNNGVGSKNWNKAIALLAKSEDSRSSTSYSDGKDSNSTGESDTPMQDAALDIPKKRTGKLRSYSETRFRLAEKAMKIADARTVSIVSGGSDGEGAASAKFLAGHSKGVHTSDTDSHNNSINSSTSTIKPRKTSPFPRPFRRTDRPSRSLIDQAIMLSNDLDYNLWDLAGSTADSVKDRVVDASSSSTSFHTSCHSRETLTMEMPTTLTDPGLATVDSSSSSMLAPRASSPAADNSLSWNDDDVPFHLPQFADDSSSGHFANSALPPSPPPPPQRPSIVPDQRSSLPPIHHHLSSPQQRHSSPPPPTSPLLQQQPDQYPPFVSQTSQALLDLTSRMKSTKISTALSRAREERMLLQSARSFSTSSSSSAPAKEEKTKKKGNTAMYEVMDESDMEEEGKKVSPGEESEASDTSITKRKVPRKVNYTYMLQEAIAAVDKEEGHDRQFAEAAAATAKKGKAEGHRAGKKVTARNGLARPVVLDAENGDLSNEESGGEKKKRGRPVGSKTKKVEGAISLSDMDSAEEVARTITTSPSKRKQKDRSTPPKVDSDEASTDDEILKALAEVDGKAPKKSRKKQVGDSPRKTAASSSIAPGAGASKQPTLTATVKTTKKQAGSSKSTASTQDDPPAKSSTKAKGKAKAIEKPPPVFDKSKYSLPDYDSWSKEALQAETKKYGYKPSGAKPVLVGQLVRVWRAINPQEAEKMDKAQAAFDRRQQKKLDKASGVSSSAGSDEAGEDIKDRKKQKEKKEPALAPWKPRPKPKSVSPARSRKSSISSSGSSDERPLKEVAAAVKATTKAKVASTSIKPLKKTATKLKASTSSPLKRRRPSRSGSLSSSIRTASDQEEILLSESEAEETKTAGERLRAEVLKDQVLYLRLLRYEPICFTVFESMATQAGIKISKVALRDWLDSQAIIFYYPQEVSRNAKRNGAARKRHP